MLFCQFFFFSLLSFSHFFSPPPHFRGAFQGLQGVPQFHWRAYWAEKLERIPCWSGCEWYLKLFRSSLFRLNPPPRKTLNREPHWLSLCVHQVAGLWGHVPCGNHAAAHWGRIFTAGPLCPPLPWYLPLFPRLNFLPLFFVSLRESATLETTLWSSSSRIATRPLIWTLSTRSRTTFSRWFSPRETATCKFLPNNLLVLFWSSSLFLSCKQSELR